MFSFIARRIKTSGHQRGLSLVELLVTIMIFSMMMVMVTGFFMGASKTISLARGMTENTKTVSNAMSAVSRAIRAGTNNPVAGNSIPDPAFKVANSDEVVFYAYVNLSDAMEKPVMYRFSIDRTTGTLTESQWPATALPNGKWSFPSASTAPAYKRVIAQTIAPYTSGDHPFTFVLADKSEPSPGTGGLTLAQRQQIVAVRVTLTVQSSLTDGSKSVTLLNLVGMPNLGYSEEAE